MTSNLKTFKLVEKRVKKDLKQYLSHVSARNSRTEILEHLIENEKNLVFRKHRQFGNSYPLHVAASVGNIEACKYLLSKKAPINAKDSVSILYLGNRVNFLP